ncbi:hypothetical protein BJY04DRAFT_188551 [Aspergillus karnatakaensis]|uniref:uncharacterized protein n=1 Tax=Aspergillus karnatakaensis TaxID=1810916 RepID=UPI003CCCC38F
MTPDDQSEPDFKILFAGGEPLNISFPALEGASTMVIDGNLAGFHMPSLREADQRLWISSETPFSLNLPIESAGGIYINGADDVRFPNLTGFGDIYIMMDGPFDCPGLARDLDKTTGVVMNGERKFSCYADDEPSAGLVAGAKAGIGVGAGLGGIGLILFVIWVWNRGTEKQRELEDKQRAQEVNGDVELPPYSR